MKNLLTDLDFGKVTFLENILIAELNEGILFDVESNRKLLELGREAFGSQPYGYISHRVHSYAVDPMVYRESAGTDSLRAIAVVTKDPLAKQNAIIERQFYKDSNCFEIFENLEEAVNWIKFQI